MSFYFRLIESNGANRVLPVAVIWARSRVSMWYNMNIYYGLILIHCFIAQLKVSALPFLFGPTSNNGNYQQRRQIVEWQPPLDEWNITSVPRSIIPFLKARNNSGYYLYPKAEETDRDDEILRRLQEIKVCAWFNEIWIKTKKPTPNLIKKFRIFYFRSTIRVECCGSIRPILCTIHHLLTKR